MTKEIEEVSFKEILGEKDWSTKELIEIAIKGEAEERGMYKELVPKVPKVFVEKINLFAEQESRHEDTLRGIFQDFFPDSDVQISDKPSFSYGIDIDDETSLLDLLEKGIILEKKSYQYYQKMANSFEDKSLQRLISYVAYMERGHYEALKSERDSVKEIGGEEAYLSVTEDRF